jgi:hypothetical protein
MGAMLPSCSCFYDAGSHAGILATTCKDSITDEFVTCMGVCIRAGDFEQYYQGMRAEHVYVKMAYSLRCTAKRRYGAKAVCPS